MAPKSTVPPTRFPDCGVVAKNELARAAGGMSTLGWPMGMLTGGYTVTAGGGGGGGAKGAAVRGRCVRGGGGGSTAGSDGEVVVPETATRAVTSSERAADSIGGTTVGDSTDTTGLLCATRSLTGPRRGSDSG